MDPSRAQIVLIGLMGAGKSAIGSRLATRLGLPFVDADSEIEAAAGSSVAEIFRERGEAAFRDGERAVMRRLLDGEPKVLATGGGAYVDAGTRALVEDKAVSVWLRADLEVLVTRTSRRDHRPILREGDPREILQRLIDQRYPVYAQADLTVDSTDGPIEETLARVIEALEQFAEPGTRSGDAVKGGSGDAR